MSYVNVSGAVSVAAGTVALPALTFASDLDCGYYRIGANDIGLAINGVKTAEYTATAVTLAPAGTTTLNLAATNAALGQSTTANYSVHVRTGTLANAGALTRLIGTNGATITGAGAMPAASLVQGVVACDATAGAQNVTLPSAADVIALVPGMAIGDAFDFIVTNTGGNSTTIQASGDATTSFSGTAAVATGTNARYTFRMTGASAATVYRA